MRIVTLMTTHNRRELLQQALDALYVSAKVAGASVRVIIANSGSQSLQYAVPETAEDIEFSVVEKTVPETSFWANGMRSAWEANNQTGTGVDFILWLNEDTILEETGLRRLLQAAEANGRREIIVGSTKSREGKFSYGGKNQAGKFLRLHFRDVFPNEDTPKPAETFNGNCVLIPSEIDKRLGGFPKGFTHLRADLAYGLLAKRRGIKSLVASGFVAFCEPNTAYPKYQDLAGAGLSARLTFVRNPKVGPLSEHIRFCLRFGGVLGPLYAFAPFIRSLVAR